MSLCAVCGTRRAVHRHHLVKQQKIRARWRSLKYKARGVAPYKLTTVLNDPRIYLEVCGFDGCHQEETPMPLPDGFWDAIDHYGLAPDLPRWLADADLERRRPKTSIFEDHYTNTVEDAAEYQRMRELP